MLQVKKENNTYVARRPDRKILLIVCCIEQCIDLSQILILPLTEKTSSLLLYGHLTQLDLLSGYSWITVHFFYSNIKVSH